MAGSPDRLAAGRRRARRQGLLLAPLLVSLGAAGAIFLAAQESDNVQVMSLVRPMQRGDVLVAEDLAPVGLAADGVRLRVATPASAQRDLVGKVLLIDLPPGTLVTPEMVAAATPPMNGVAVGVRVPADALPAATLRAGEWVQVVRTDPATGQSRVIATSAEVLAVQPTGTESTGRDGDTVVYLAVPPEAAADVAGAASNDRGVRLLGVRP